MTIGSKLRNAFKQMVTDPIVMDDTDYPDDGDAGVTAFGDPIFIHAAQIATRWEQVIDLKGLQGTDLVLRITGTTPGSDEPITVDIGLRGATCDTLAQLLRNQYIGWVRNYYEEDTENFNAWEAMQHD